MKMKRNILMTALTGMMVVLTHGNTAHAHCQMPCGIYHDDMVYDQIDQYVETMYKGVSMLNDTHFQTVKEKNEFVRWVVQKENASNEMATLFTTYFLQQKIKPGEKDTAKRLESAHRLLFILTQIKQNTEIKFVEEFADEWEKFKLMFHVEGYECQIELLKQRKRQEELKKKGIQPDQDHSHEHDHDHDHDHDDHDHKH
jgi:nickel superoxide dismutase